MIFDLQKASMWKRISAWMFDAIILGILVVGIAFCLSAILGYDDYSAALSECYADYEQRYGVTFDISEETYQALSPQEKQALEDASRELSEDREAGHLYSMVVNLTLVISSLSLLTGFLILEFFVPMFFGNGQTLGKKIFSVALMRVDGVRVSNLQMFVRTILGKFTIETMIPVLVVIMIFFGTLGILGTALVLGLGLLQLILVCATRTNSFIHDLLANTVVIDMPSQMIFESEQAMVDYKKKVHAEQAARQEY